MPAQAGIVFVVYFIDNTIVPNTLKKSFLISLLLIINNMILRLTFALLLFSNISFGQKNMNVIKPYADSSEVKLVLRTEKYSGDRHVVQDNLTFKIHNDTTQIYYMNYIDGTVSSLMIPYSVIDRFIDFEESIIGIECPYDNCQYSVVFANGPDEQRVYINASQMYMLEELMLELEE